MAIPDKQRRDLNKAMVANQKINLGDIIDGLGTISTTGNAITYQFDINFEKDTMGSRQ